MMRTRKTFFLLAILIVAAGVSATAWKQQNESNMSIKVGDPVPVFTLPDQNGEEFDVSKMIGVKNLVIYFYPKDDTPGCTKEACKFRDDYEDFTDLGALVIGISSDDVESHKKFAAKHNLPFTLLSDSDKAVRKQFGVPTNLLGLLPGRVTYVVDRDGIVQGVFNSQFKAEQHIEEAKNVLKGLAE
jgi:peroxiredoxin Q/BCP